jgi:hypothetical protein
MDNNDILKKLRVALKLRDDEIVEIMKLVDFRITKTELGAFFRNSDHPNYKEAGDQILRNFLNGLVIHLRGPKEEKVSGETAEVKSEGPKKVKPKFERKPDFEQNNRFKRKPLKKDKP